MNLPSPAIALESLAVPDSDEQVRDFRSAVRRFVGARIADSATVDDII